MHDIKNPAYEKHNHLEQIELRYEKITWTYKDGNIIHSDRLERTRHRVICPSYFAPLRTGDVRSSRPHRYRCGRGLLRAIA